MQKIKMTRQRKVKKEGKDKDRINDENEKTYRKRSIRKKSAVALMSIQSILQHIGSSIQNLECVVMI